MTIMRFCCKLLLWREDRNPWDRFIRQVKYLNNILEQDHRFIKRITGPMMGFKVFHSAVATLDGIKTAHMIRKGQFANENRAPFQVFADLTG